MIATKQAPAALCKPAKKLRKEALANVRASKEAERLGQVPEPGAASPSTSATPAADPISNENENGIQVKLSASKRKLDVVADLASQASDMRQPLLLLDLSRVTALFKPFSCNSCGRFTVISDTPKSFVCQLKTVCLRCEEVLLKTMTSKTLKGSCHYGINRRAVLSIMNVGLTTFCEIMGLGGLTEKSFASHVREIQQASDCLKTALLKKAVKKVYEAQGKAEGNVLDIAVSYDGT